MGKISFNPEEVGEGALNILKNEKTIVDFTHCLKNSPDDKNGVDFFAHLWNGLWMPLQFTGDPKYVREHYNKHPNVRFVIVVSRNRPRFIAKKIKKILKNLKNYLNN